MSKKLIALIVLVIITALAVAGFWYWRDTVFSKEILKLEILGPDSVNMGDEVVYTVKYKNNGNFVLESPRLFFELPDNSLTEDGKNRITQDVGDIYPGVERVVTFKARLLGKEGDVKTAHAWLSYVPKNLSVRYESETTLATKIDKVPITLTYDMPSRIEKGKEATYSINYFSNIDYPLENLSVRVEPTGGFTITSSQPSSLDKAEWKLDTLNKNQGGRITIKGNAMSDAGSSIHFSANIGMWVDGVFVVVKNVTQDVDVIQSQLSIIQKINGSVSYVASPGEQLNYEITVQNIGSTPFNDVFASLKLDTSLIDTATLQSQKGDVQNDKGIVVFDSKKISDLLHLYPNQQITLNFSVQVKKDWPVQVANAALIKNVVSVFDINQSFMTKVAANLVLLQKVTKKDAKTYTITWEASNAINDVKNVKVKVLLPVGATLGDEISPESEVGHFSWDNGSRQIVWAVGDMANGAHNSLTFEVASNSSQPIGQSIITGDDQFTGSVISHNAVAQ